MKTTRIISLVFLVSILGCHKNYEPRSLVATKTISVYKTYEGDALQEIFKLTPGDQCAVGREEVEKMFGYLEIVCPRKGYGWVVKGPDYEIIDKESASANVNKIRPNQKEPPDQKAVRLSSAPLGALPQVVNRNLDGLLISNVLGFVVGLLVSFVFWFVFFRIIVPKIGFSESILKRISKSTAGYDYRIRFKNLGRRAVISLECVARFIIDWEGSGTWTAIYIPMNLDGQRKTELPKIARAKNKPGYGGTRTMFLYPNLVSEFSTSPRYSEEFRSKATSGTLELEDLFHLGADAELKVYVFGYDEFSGARKMFESKYYKLSDIKSGEFKNQGLEVEVGASEVAGSGMQSCN